MENEWLPDPEVMEKLEEILRKQDQEDRVAVGSRILTWQELVGEVRRGTEFGRRFYAAFTRKM